MDWRLPLVILIQKANRFGWLPKISIEDGIRETVQYLMAEEARDLDDFTSINQLNMIYIFALNNILEKSFWKQILNCKDNFLK